MTWTRATTRKPTRPQLCASEFEVTNVSHQSFWPLIAERELFVPFDLFPWFHQATIGQLVGVTMPHRGHLARPQLDVKLAVESIEHTPGAARWSANRRRVRSTGHLSDRRISSRCDSPGCLRIANA